MNLLLRVSLHQNFRTYELVEVLFLKRYSFDISLDQLKHRNKNGALICKYQIGAAVLIREGRSLNYFQ